MKNIYITLAGNKFKVLDALNNITIPDCFGKNKIGKGHGEAKLYVGYENERFHDFFDDLNRECFFIKSDFDKYLLDAKSEFLNPQQFYQKPDKIKSNYEDVKEKLRNYKQGLLKFEIKRIKVKGSRVYINSENEYYNLLRTISLPNISYLSILKLESKSGKILYYYRMFIDYRNDLVKYESPAEKEQTSKINNNKKISDKRKTNLIQARVGQGEYRQKLIEDCQFCPFTLINDERLLIASHIKPWAVSNDAEKIDFKNGFALTPTFDRLFDQGYITFQEDKTVIVSPWISPMNQKKLNIYSGKSIPKLQLDDKRNKYLVYHRENIYKG